MLADHNSVLDPHLDQHPPAEVGPSHKLKAREREQAAYVTMDLLDTWPVAHEAVVIEEEGKGLTTIIGVRTFAVGHSDHNRVVLQLHPEEDAGVSRRTIPVDIIRQPEFQMRMRE